MATFKELLKASMKSEDTEEWLDVYFTRPIGLAFALMWMKLGATPNFVTILSMFLGIGAGWCFIHTSLWWNVGGVALMMLANFCDSTDGQMARLMNCKTPLGRALDGFASEVWYFCCYWAIVIRLWNQPIPLTTTEWGPLILLLCCYSGFLCHARQCQLADYYRQIHLYFIMGEEGSELNSCEQQQRMYESLPSKGALFQRLYYFSYMSWCRRQEQATPEFQRFFRKVKARYPNAGDMPAELRQTFRRQSLPLMKYTNILTHNTRVTVLYIACLINLPWIYPLFEITVLEVLHYYMKNRHEQMCKAMTV